MILCAVREPFCVKRSCGIAIFLRVFSGIDSVLNFLPDFDSAVWKQVKKEADGHIRELPKGLIAGSDVSAEAVSAARTNLMGLHYGNNVSVERADFRKLPALEGHVIVTNPPYGIRMGGDENLEMFYKNLGDFLKQKCKGSTAFPPVKRKLINFIFYLISIT